MWGVALSALRAPWVSDLFPLNDRNATLPTKVVFWGEEHVAGKLLGGFDRYTNHVFEWSALSVA